MNLKPIRYYTDESWHFLITSDDKIACFDFDTLPSATGIAGSHNAVAVQTYPHSLAPFGVGPSITSVRNAWTSINYASWTNGTVITNSVSGLTTSTWYLSQIKLKARLVDSKIQLYWHVVFGIQGGQWEGDKIMTISDTSIFGDYTNVVWTAGYPSYDAYSDPTVLTLAPSA